MVTTKPETKSLHNAGKLNAPRCCICGERIPIVFTKSGYQTTIGQNNPWPIVDDDTHVCCEDCNAMFVISARMMLYDNDASGLHRLATVLDRAGARKMAVRGLEKLAAKLEKEGAVANA